MAVTAVLKDYTTGKVEHLEHYFERVSKVEVVFNPEKDGTFSSEIVLHAPKHTLVAHAGGKSATASLDLAVEKMERILTKHKEKMRGPVKGGGRRNGRRGAAPSAEETPGEEVSDLSL
jgi:putative sigma-54 modulation protein